MDEHCVIFKYKGPDTSNNAIVVPGRILKPLANQIRPEAHVIYNGVLAGLQQDKIQNSNNQKLYKKSFSGVWGNSSWSGLTSGKCPHILYECFALSFAGFGYDDVSKVNWS